MMNIIKNMLKKSRVFVFASQLASYASRHQVIASYLKNNKICRLQVGSGPSNIEGWLNSDIEPNIFRGQIYINMSRKLPVESNSLDYIFSEHSLEHIPFNDGVRFLSEAYRVLKNKGVIRISTPDLFFLFRLLQDKSRLSPAQNDYIKWASEEFIKGKYKRTSRVVNNFFRAWGHKYIWDFETIREVLEDVGFTGICLCSPGSSVHIDLQKMESHFKTNNPTDDFYLVETFIVEATK